MAKFNVYAVNSETEEIHEFLYDNDKSYLFDTTKGIQYPKEKLEKNENNYNNIAFPLTKDNPVNKIRDFRKLKISFGLKCNYSCEYCSQKFVPGAEVDNKTFDLDVYLKKLYSTFNFGEDGLGKTIEFWGGEPLLYWNKIVPIAESIKLKYPKISFSIITNGSLITKEKADWLYDMGFYVGISHDGPGQKVRGPNPFDVPKIKESILYLHRKFAAEDRTTFNSMLNKDNTSRKAIADYFIELTGNKDVKIGEGGFVDAYDEGGLEMSLGKEYFKKYSKNSFKQIRQHLCTNFSLVKVKITNFFQTFHFGTSSKVISQKCGMDKEYNIAVDLSGNVITCQNVSANAIAPNGNSHKIGHIDDFDSIKLTTATHWSHRKDCSTCPVLQLCQGSCMFLERELWDASCNNAYYDNIPYFCSVIEHMTGCIPIYIDGDLPEERKDIFGLFENGRFSEENFDSKKFYEFLETP